MTSRNLVRRHFNEVGTSRRLPFSAKCSYIYIYIQDDGLNQTHQQNESEKTETIRLGGPITWQTMSIMREFLFDEGRQGVPPMEARDMVPVPWSASLSAQLLLSRKVCEKSSCMFLEKQLLHRLQRSHSTGEWSLVTWIVIDSKLIYKIMVCYLWCYHIIYFIRLKI
jgi:hypothetical protein